MYWLLLLPEALILGVVVLWLALRRAEYLRLTSAFGAPVALARVRWAGLTAGRRASMAAAAGWTLVSAGNVAMWLRMAAEGRRPVAYSVTQVLFVLVAWGVGIWVFRGPEPLAVFQGGVFWRRLWRWEDLAGYRWSEGGQDPAELIIQLEPAAGRAQPTKRRHVEALRIPSANLTSGDRSTIDLLLARHLGRNEQRSRAAPKLERR